MRGARKSPKEAFRTHKKQGEMVVAARPPTHEAPSIAPSLLRPCQPGDILSFGSSVFSLNWAFRLMNAGRGTRRSSLKHAWF